MGRRHIDLRLEVSIQLFRADADTPRWPLVNGSRPILRFNDGTFAGMIEVETDEPITPGATGAATILVDRSVTEYVLQRVSEGDTVDLCLATTPIGTVRVIRARLHPAG